jgi:hypothetical protein
MKLFKFQSLKLIINMQIKTSPALKSKTEQILGSLSKSIRTPCTIIKSYPSKRRFMKTQREIFILFDKWKAAKECHGFPYPMAIKADEQCSSSDWEVYERRTR